MNKIGAVVLAVAVLAGVGFYLYNQEPAGESAQGRVILGITDAAASLNNVSSILLTVDKAELHSETDGWVTLSVEPKEFDLVALKQSGLISLFASANVDADSYDQVKLTVDKVVVVKGNVEDEAKLPSGSLKFVGNFVVEPDTTSAIVIDFLVDKSLHVTGNGKLIFAPVVKLESKSNADVEVDSDNAVTIRGGRSDTSAEVGMDANGEMKTNFAFGANDKIDILGGVLKISAQGDNETSAKLKVDTDTAIEKALASGHLDTALSIKLTNLEGKAVWSVGGTSNLELKNVYVDAMTGAILKVE